jgi:Ca2+-binding EF-hand superfamily protein
MNKTPLQVLTLYDTEGTRNLTLRNFKAGINSLKALSQYQIDNLAKYLDEKDDGFITIDKFDAALRGQHVAI